MKVLEPDTSGAAVSSSRFESFDGTKIAYRRYGEPSSLTPLVCCSGIACDEMYWSFFAPAMGAERQVVTWDYPYHGDSSPAGDEREITIGSLSRHTSELMKHLQIERAAFVGHSMGVQVVLETYGQNPQTVAGMIFIAGPHQHTVGHLYGTSVGRYVLSFIELGAKLQPEISQLLWTIAVRPELADPIGRIGGLIGRAPPELMARYFEHLARLDVGTLAEMFKHGQEHSAEQMLERVKVPVLILHGTHDVMTPLGLAEEMAQRIPDAELVAVEGGAHTLPIEDPDLINRETRRFLRVRVDPARSN
jgi:pimeloyl-ACP methyl ester carboxylesterase